MTLARIYKGLMLSEGFVATPRVLREFAPEALPAPAADDPRAPTQPSRSAGGDYPRLVVLQFR